MILRCVCWSIFLCLALGPTVKAQVTVDDQGYQNVLISFAPNVSGEEGKQIVEEIQNLLRNTSRVLHKAIGIRIASATFLLPPSWSTEKWKDITVTPTSSEQTERRSDIIVDATEQSPFGKQPFTLQHGGCGVAGHQITLPLDFVNNTKGYPKGKLLAREWLKYRYGVFDENGFPGDLFYPDYYRIPVSSEIRITDCTNSKIAYIFKKPILGDACNMDSVAGDFGYCRAHPDEKSAANVTSSLMYFHKELPNMEHICGKDGHPHHSTARNKQNALCNSRSIWDVVKSSDDFKTTRHQSIDPDTESIQFSYIQEGKPRFVVLLENSDNFFKKEIPSAIRFALRRFYYDLPPKSKLAIYTYSSDVAGALPYIELPAQERSDLGVIADFGSPATSICTSCGLAKAVQILLLDSEVEKGSILLITTSPLEKVPEFSEKLKDSGIRLHVLRFIGEDYTIDKSYEALADSFGRFSYELLQSSLDVVDIFNTLFRFLQNPVPNFNDEFEIKTVASGNMSAQIPVTIPRDPTAELYTLWLGRALGISSIECKAGDSVVELKPETTATDIASFTFAPMDDDVTCRLGSAKQPPALTQVQLTTKKGHYFDFDVWIHDVSTKEEQRPIIIYAKIYFGEYPIKYANVTMVVKSEKNPEEIVKMLDNGHGDPDVTQYDGIYSGYFSSFLAAGRYLISVKIDDNEGEAKIGKGNPSLTPSTCCGSKVVSEDHDVPAFKMEKNSVYEAKNKRPGDGYPPSRILNLLVLVFQISKKVTLVWTTPGGGKAARYAIKLFLNREDAVSNFDTPERELNASSIVTGSNGETARIDFPFEDLEQDVTYYVTIRSWNEFNKSSEISNVAEFIIPKSGEETSVDGSSSTPGSTTDGGIIKHDKPQNNNKTIGIVFGVLGGIVALCILVYLGYYFFVKKPQRNNAM